MFNIIHNIFAYPFVDLDLRVRTFFEKDGETKNRDVEFETGNIDTSAHLYWRLKKFSWRTCLLSYCSFGDKKSFLDLYFHPTIIEFRIEENRYLLRLLLMCLEALEKGFSCFPGREWEWVIRNLLSLEKLYKRI